jgi:hypothetical protein
MQLPLDWRQIKQIRQSQHPQVNNLLERFKDVFSEGLGCYT